jgi:hypothetical protein
MLDSVKNGPRDLLMRWTNAWLTDGAPAFAVSVVDDDDVAVVVVAKIERKKIL